MKYTLDESLFEEFEDEQENGAGEGSYDRDEAATIRGTVSDLMNDTWNLINKLGATSDFMEEQYPSRADVLEILEAINTDEHNHIGQFEALLGAFSEGMDAVESGKEEAEGVLDGGEPAEEVPDEAPEEEPDEDIEESIEQKSNGKWTNKGKDGEHGDFKTKKEARAQQKAMFANGWHEDLDADRAERIKKYKANKKGGCCGKGCDEKDVKDELEQPVDANAEVLTEETAVEASDDNRVEKYFNTVSTSLCSMLGRWLRQHGYKLSGDCAALIWDQLRRKENFGGNVVVDVNINTDRPLAAEDESSLRNVVGEWCDKMCNKDDATCYDYCCTPEITDNGTGGVKLRLSFLDDDGAIVEFD